ncbi:MAG: GNAT family N-acetyltransferase [Pleurocapsa sp. MO_226.B13]|nr:GNAT family N-acetyltransferase [Pleurocapsa sp. MO_226.B13]
MVLQSLDNNVSNHSQLAIQLAALKDTRAISSVLAKSFYDFPQFARWVYPFLQFTIEEDLRYRLRSHSPLYSCLVAKFAQPDPSNTTKPNLNYAIVGTAEITLRSTSFWSNGPQYPYISNLAVKQEYRRLGIGSKLLAKCEQIALDWGYRETRLHVLERNQSGKHLYYKNGYQISQVESNWENLWFDCSSRLLLQKNNLSN